MKKRLSLRFPTYNLRNRTDNCRPENDSFRFCKPEPRRLMGDDGESSFIAKVSVDYGKDFFPDQPLQHVKYCWTYRRHIVWTRLADLVLNAWFELFPF